MDVNDHNRWVGAIVMNLQSLETVLRYFLLVANGQNANFPKVGDKDTSITYLSDYRSLNNLIMLYNEKLSEAETETYGINSDEILKVRDAIAHGRLVTTNELPATLWKFGKPTNGRVPVEYCSVLTPEYLVQTSNYVGREKDKVVSCFQSRGYKGLR